MNLVQILNKIQRFYFEGWFVNRLLEITYLPSSNSHQSTNFEFFSSTSTEEILDQATTKQSALSHCNWTAKKESKLIKQRIQPSTTSFWGFWTYTTSTVHNFLNFWTQKLLQVTKLTVTSSSFEFCVSVLAY